jgi:hypothetical protein
MVKRTPPKPKGARGGSSSKAQGFNVPFGAVVAVAVIGVAYLFATSLVEGRSSLVAEKMSEADGALSRYPGQAVTLYREVIVAAGVWPIDGLFKDELTKANQQAAQALEKLDKYDEAIQHAKAAHQLDPSNQGVLKHLTILLSAGSHKEINEALRYAQKLDDLTGNDSMMCRPVLSVPYTNCPCHDVQGTVTSLVRFSPQSKSSSRCRRSRTSITISKRRPWAMADRFPALTTPPALTTASASTQYACATPFGSASIAVRKCYLT